MHHSLETDDLGVNIETFADCNDFLCVLGRHIYFHAMSHVEDFVHLFPIGATAMLDGFE